MAMCWGENEDYFECIHGFKEKARILQIAAERKRQAKLKEDALFLWSLHRVVYGCEGCVSDTTSAVGVLIEYSDEPSDVIIEY